MLHDKRILLVEDSAHDAELTLLALNESQLAGEVAIVRDGADALDYLYHRGDFAKGALPRPAVVILDLKTPRVDGIEVLRQMKADSRLRRLPVVMLTSSREKQDLDECYRLGANAYVVKPVGFQDFLETIQEIGVFWAMVNVTSPGSTIGSELGAPLEKCESSLARPCAP